MKTYKKPFDIKAFDIMGARESQDLFAIIDYRQDAFCKSEEYKTIDNKILALKEEILKTSKSDIEIPLKKLLDEITNLECTCYNAAYKDGMSDLMVALTLNKIQITEAEFIL
ncbi:hypothetical protein OXPF_34450 [Oxobacter pfennigii]|uniref:Uncharacterized protein n=1 Tax=Oxobacter pfennigii TaxID=36849 RepID=A0A0P9AD30_9CLOT|nr:hypothetical protein [Oxobacter pfennigii]KPU43013.1 hypothetical protein OXPF_34450 [Oxobacter pfennigii]